MGKIKLGKYIDEYSHKNRTREPYPVYSITNSNGFCTEYFTKDVSSEDKSGYKLVPYGYFAYNPSRINVGSVDCQTKEEIVIVSPLYTVFKVSKGLNIEYLRYFFKSNYCKYLIKSKVSGSVRFNLKFDTLKTFEINEIKLEDQKKAVDLFVSIENLIKTEEKELALCDELIKSRFNEMFGDPILNEKGFNTIPLKDLAPFNSIKGKVEVGENTWLLNLDMIESNSGDVIGKLRTSKVDGSTIEFDTTCVLYSKLRPYLNKVVVPNEVGYATSELISMKCDPKKVNRQYLATALRHKSFVDYINSKTAGAKMPRASMNELRRFGMPLPNIELQNKFSDFVEQIDKLKFSGVRKQKRAHYSSVFRLS